MKNKKVIYGVTAASAVIALSIGYVVLNNKPERTDQVTLSSAKSLLQVALKVAQQLKKVVAHLRRNF